MPSDHQDSELVLSNEIVRALGNELTRLRACNADLKASVSTLGASKNEADRKIQTLVSRNGELEGENERLQKELDDTRRSLQGRIKEEDSEPCILSAGSPYEQVRRKLAETEQRLREEGLEHARVVEALEERLEKTKRKRKESKEALLQAQKELATLQAVHERKDETSSQNDVKHPYEHPEPVNATSAGHDIHETLHYDYFASTFFERRPFGVFTGLGVRSFLTPPGVEPWGDIRESLKEPSALDCTWKFIQDETIWSLANDRCLFLLPDQLYDRHTGETNTIHGTGPRVGDRRDLFLRDRRKRTYCGIYECTGVSSESLEVVSRLTRLRANVINTIILRTCGSGIGGRELNTKIRSMYHSGQILVRCHKLEKVGVNRDIENALSVWRSEYDGKLELLNPKHSSDEDESGSRKRSKLS